MRRDARFARFAGAVALAALGAIPAAQAGSIQQPGLTTGMPEGYGLYEGLYSVTGLNVGQRDDLRMITAIPMFMTWSTPWEIGGGRVLFKAAPLVGVSLSAPGLTADSIYNPYAGAWLSWYLGNGVNLAIGEGVQFGLGQTVPKLTGRNFNAFQQNVAVSYAKDNWNLTANSFYTTGKVEANKALQPRTFNVDLTATKRFGRDEWGVIGYGQWDLNNPAGYGGKQSEFALGFLYGHLIGNFMNLQFKVTRDVQEKNLGGKDTRIWVQLVIPLWTPPAPEPSKAPPKRTY